MVLEKGRLGRRAMVRMLAGATAALAIPLALLARDSSALLFPALTAGRATGEQVAARFQHDGIRLLAWPGSLGGHLLRTIRDADQTARGL